MIKLWNATFSAAEVILPLGAWKDLDTFLTGTGSQAVALEEYRDKALPKAQAAIQVSTEAFNRLAAVNLVTSNSRAYWVAATQIGAKVVTLSLSYSPLLSNCGHVANPRGHWNALSTIGSQKVGGLQSFGEGFYHPAEVEPTTGSTDYIRCLWAILDGLKSVDDSQVYKSTGLVSALLVPSADGDQCRTWRPNSPGESFKEIEFEGGGNYGMLPLFSSPRFIYAFAVYYTLKEIQDNFAPNFQFHDIDKRVPRDPDGNNVFVALPGRYNNDHKYGLNVNQTGTVNFKRFLPLDNLVDYKPRKFAKLLFPGFSSTIDLDLSILQDDFKGLDLLESFITKHYIRITASSGDEKVNDVVNRPVLFEASLDPETAVTSAWSTYVNQNPYSSGPGYERKKSAMYRNMEFSQWQKNAGVVTGAIGSIGGGFLAGGPAGAIIGAGHAIGSAVGNVAGAVQNDLNYEDALADMAGQRQDIAAGNSAVAASMQSDLAMAFQKHSYRRDFPGTLTPYIASSLDLINYELKGAEAAEYEYLRNKFGLGVALFGDLIDEYDMPGSGTVSSKGSYIFARASFAYLPHSAAYDDQDRVAIISALQAGAECYFPDAAGAWPAESDFRPYERRIED